MTMQGVLRRYFRGKDPGVRQKKQDSTALSQAVFDAMSHLLHGGLNVQEATDWMIRQGIPFSQQAGMHLIGAESLLQALQQQRNLAYSQYHFADAFKELAKDLKNIVHQERQSISSSTLSARQKEERLAALPALQPPQPPQKTLHSLLQYNKKKGFLGANAQKHTQQWADHMQEIVRLERFNLRHGTQFYGPEKVGFRGALALSQQFEQMLQLSEALRTGTWEQANPKEMENILEEDALRSLQIISSLTKMLHDEGWLKHAPGNRFRLTAKGVRRVGKNALKALSLQAPVEGRHGKFTLSNAFGRGFLDKEVSKRYQFGDSLEHLHPVNTLKNALIRRGKNAFGPAKSHTLWLAPEDFEVWHDRKTVRSATVLLLDMSWSMARQGRFAAAKQVALALDCLIHSQQSQDAYYVVGFSTRAHVIKPSQLAEISWDTKDPFTNLQEGLALARQLLTKHKNEKGNILVITDGKPTAATINRKTTTSWSGFMGAIPPKILHATLHEVRLCTRKGLHINVFMLDDNPILMRFVEKLAKINAGRVFYSHPSALHRCVLVDYWRKQRRRIA